MTAIREGGERLSFVPSEHDAVCRLLSLTRLDERMNFSGPIAISEGAAASDAESLLPAA